jgi:hypothetical protein
MFTEAQIMAMLPPNWSQLGASAKVQFFKDKGVSVDNLLQAGMISQADAPWFISQGLTASPSLMTVANVPEQALNTIRSAILNNDTKSGQSVAALAQQYGLSEKDLASVANIPVNELNQYFRDSGIPLGTMLTGTVQRTFGTEGNIRQLDKGEDVGTEQVIGTQDGKLLVQQYDAYGQPTGTRLSDPNPSDAQGWLQALGVVGSAIGAGNLVDSLFGGAGAGSSLAVAGVEGAASQAATTAYTNALAATGSTQLASIAADVASGNVAAGLPVADAVAAGLASATDAAATGAVSSTGNIVGGGGNVVSAGVTPQGLATTPGGLLSNPSLAVGGVEGAASQAATTVQQAVTNAGGSQAAANVASNAAIQATLTGADVTNAVAQALQSSGFSELAPSVVNSMSSVGTGIGNIGTNLGTGLGNLGTNLGTGLGNIGTNLGQGLGTGLSEIGTNLGTGIGNIGTGLGNIGTSLGTGLSEIGSNLGTGIGNLGTGLGNIGTGLGAGLSEIGTNLGTGIGNLGTGLGNIGSSLGTGLGSIGTALGTGLGGLGTGIAQGLGQGLGNIASSLFSGITNAVSSVANTDAQNVLGNLISSGANLAMVNDAAQKLRDQGKLTQTEYANLATNIGGKYDALGKQASEMIGNFTPYGVTNSLFGTSYDPKTGAVNTALTEDARQMYNPFAQAAMQSAQAANMTNVDQLSQDYYNKLSALSAPETERQRLATEARLRAQGRLGVSGSAYGGSSPELLAQEQAIAQQQLQRELQSRQAALGERGTLINQGVAALSPLERLTQQQLAQAQLSGNLGQQQMAGNIARTQAFLQPSMAGLAQQANLQSMGLAGNLQAQQEVLAGLLSSRQNVANQVLGTSGTTRSGGLLGGLLGNVLNPNAAGNLNTTGFGTGIGYGNQDIGLFI